jgi:hypothetical protein
MLYYRWKLFEMLLKNLRVQVQINEFVKLGGEQLVSYYADILGGIFSLSRTPLFC